jgi:hypothetical protein
MKNAMARMWPPVSYGSGSFQGYVWKTAGPPHTGKHRRPHRGPRFGITPEIRRLPVRISRSTAERILKGERGALRGHPPPSPVPCRETKFRSKSFGLGMSKSPVFVKQTPFHTMAATLRGSLRTFGPTLP